MAACPHCKATVLFGGVRDGEHRYCNESCRQHAAALLELDAFPDEVVLERARELRSGTCPRCDGPGPIEVHYAHRAVSALVVTSWKSVPHVLCRSCARAKQAQDLLVTTLCGWWGFPWGLLMTPIQLVRGLAAVTKGDFEREAEPSDDLLAAVRYRLLARGPARVERAPELEAA